MLLPSGMNSDFPPAGTEQTPLMQQYWDLKSQVPDSLLLFRMGDFYELFGKDATLASQILEITLTSRDKRSENPLAMAGVPHHALQNYLPRLLRAGHKVALAEQMESPDSAGKGPVKRQITRIFSPAMQFEAEQSSSQFLAGLWQEKDRYFLAALETSTGETLISVSSGEHQGCTQEELLRQLAMINVQHLLNFTDWEPALSIPLVEKLPRQWLSPDQALLTLKNQFQASHFEAFFKNPAERHLLASVISYVLKSQKIDRLPHFQVPRPLIAAGSLSYGPETLRHLDLFPEGPASSSNKKNLFQLINRCRSSLGSRQLRRWLLEPLSDLRLIHDRQSAVQELAAHSQLNAESARHLNNIYDLERLLGRIHAGLGNPRDTLALGQSLQEAQLLLPLFAKLHSPPLLAIQQTWLSLQSSCQKLSNQILERQKSEAPYFSREGGIFNKGWNDELDRLITLSEEGEKWLLDLENREKERSGISSLKVRYNRVFGYYIEITKTHLKNVPADYQRKQSMANAERFYTEELKTFEEEMLSATSRRQAMEQQLFQDLLADIASQQVWIADLARIIAEIDALISLAVLSEKTAWTFPQIDESLELDIQAGRHPLVDESMGGAFIPNDCQLGPQTRSTLLITGPNMGGKSTVMRQVALIVILGQMGAPVPARRARWGFFDSVFTRIGAQDSIATGQSTFMVEMSELAHILSYAQRRSLIILDEIGRGTSTYDGISVAWATLEWICKVIGARTFFATHYHELTHLSEQLPNLANMHMGVQGEKGLAPGELRFEYRLREGATNDSFGVQVARLAGLPKPVIKRAWEVLKQLESGSIRESILKEDPDQLSLFQGQNTVNKDSIEWQEESPALPHPALQRLEALSVEEMTPLQALNALAELKRTMMESGGNTRQGADGA